MPEGVTSLNGNTIQVRVNIRQKMQTLSFSAVPVEVQGLGKKLAATLNLSSTNVTITGQVSLMSALSRDDVVVYADVTGLSAGTYQVELRLGLPNESMLSEVTYTIAAPYAEVIIRND